MGIDRDHGDAELTALIVGARPSEDVIERQGLARVSGELLDGRPGKVVLAARYELGNRIGMGGSGLVYAAHDRELDRRVAIKFLRFVADDPGGDECLVREARAIAQVTHPNVITVHDVAAYHAEDLDVAGERARVDGLAVGGVFLVMELVEGSDLAAHLREHRLGWRAALDLMLPVGRGLAAAHERGVVHGDFKPGNVLVGDDGRPRVVDFGLARRDPGGKVGKARGGCDSVEAETPPPSVAGTPAYMAPEQHRAGVVDARSDQFGFCCATFEAAYGKRPFAGADLDELLRNKEARAVSQPPGDSRAPAWLHRALLRGMEPSPDDRHPDMVTLLRTLERGLARRRRARTAVATIVLLVGAALGGQALHARSERAACADRERNLRGIWDTATQEAIRAAFVGTKAPYAATTLAYVEGLIGGYVDAWIEVREEVCAAGDLEGGSTQEVAGRMLCLERRLAGLAQTVRVLTQADAQIVAQAPDLVGRLPAVSGCERVAAVEAAPDPATKQQWMVMEADLARADALLVTADYDGCEELLSATLATAAQLGQAGIQARALLLRGRVQRIRTELDAAEATLFEALAHAERVGDQRTAVRAQGELVLVLSAQGDFEVANRIAEQAGARLQHEDLGAAQEGDLAESVGRLRLSEGRDAEALEELQRALELRRRAFGDEHVQVALTLYSLGEAQRSIGQWERATESYERARRVTESTVGSEHPINAMILLALGNMAVQHAQYDRARELLEQARVRLGPLMGSDHPIQARTFDRLGSLAQATGRYDVAVEYLEQALAMLERKLGKDHPEVAWAHNNLCYTLSSQERHADALEHCIRAHALLEQLLGPEHILLATPINNLGEALYGLGRYDEALGHLERALAMRRAGLPPEHPHLGFSYYNLGRVRSALGQQQQAIRDLSDAIAVWSKTYGEDHPRLADPLVAMGQAYQRLGRPRQAVAPLERAVELLETSGQDAVKLARARLSLARVVRSTDPDRAREQARLGIDALPEGREQTLRREIGELLR